MIEFTPKSGTIEIEEFDGECSLRIKVQFAEKMDPDDPRGDGPAQADLEGVPFKSNHLEELTNTKLQLSELNDEGYEGSIYYCTYHNPIDLRTVEFGKERDGMIEATLEGTIDFTYEGLSSLGTPEFCWKVPLKILDSRQTP